MQREKPQVFTSFRFLWRREEGKSHKERNSRENFALIRKAVELILWCFETTAGSAQASVGLSSPVGSPPEQLVGVE